MSKCDHRYICGTTNMFDLYTFTCIKCLKFKYGSSRMAHRLERKGKRHTYEEDWNNQLKAFISDPAYNMIPSLIMTPDKVTESFWP